MIHPISEQNSRRVENNLKINEISESNTFTIFPNPKKESIIFIQNSLGQIVYSASCNGKSEFKIFVGILENGFYTLTLSESKNEESKSQKLIIAR